MQNFLQDKILEELKQTGAENRLATKVAGEETRATQRLLEKKIVQQ